MKIMFFNAFYYPKLVGGAELSVQLLAESFSSMGNKVYVVSLSDRNYVGRKNGVVCIYLKERNIYSLDNTEEQSKAAKVLWHIIDSGNVLFYQVFKLLLRRIRPDVFHTNTLSGVSPIVWKAANDEKIAVVHTFRDYYAICHKRTLYNSKNCESLCLQCTVSSSLKRLFARNVKAFVGISNFILDKHKEYNFIDPGKSISAVISNSINPVMGDRAGCTKTSDGIQFGFIGRITPEKGLEQIMGVLDKLPAKRSFRVLIAGKVDPDYREILQNMVTEKSRVDFLGFTTQENIFRKIDVLIVPSIWHEPFGRVVIEALSFGVPVIVSNRGGLLELYDESCMWMFDPATDGLLEVMQDILQCPETVKAKAAAALAASEVFTSSNIADQYIDLYNRVLTSA